MPKLQPSGDITDGGWTAETGALDLSAEIAGLTPTDDSFIKSSNNPENDIAQMNLANPGELPRPPVTMFVRARRRGSAQLYVRLKEGSTVIREWSHANLPEDFETFSVLLTQAEFDAAVSWDDVYLEIEADAVSEAVVLDRTAATILVRNGETIVLRV